MNHDNLEKNPSILAVVNFLNHYPHEPVPSHCQTHLFNQIRGVEPIDLEVAKHLPDIVDLCLKNNFKIDLSYVLKEKENELNYLWVTNIKRNQIKRLIDSNLLIGIPKKSTNYYGLNFILNLKQKNAIPKDFNKILTKWFTSDVFELLSNSDNFNTNDLLFLIKSDAFSLLEKNHLYRIPTNQLFTRKEFENTGSNKGFIGFNAKSQFIEYQLTAFILALIIRGKLPLESYVSFLSNDVRYDNVCQYFPFFVEYLKTLDNTMLINFFEKIKNNDHVGQLLFAEKTDKYKTIISNEAYCRHAFYHAFNNPYNLNKSYFDVGYINKNSSRSRLLLFNDSIHYLSNLIDIPKETILGLMTMFNISENDFLDPTEIHDKFQSNYFDPLINGLAAQLKTVNIPFEANTDLTI